MRSHLVIRIVDQPYLKGAHLTGIMPIHSRSMTPQKPAR
jgi:hypothetical protein